MDVLGHENDIYARGECINQVKILAEKKNKTPPSDCYQSTGLQSLLRINYYAHQSRCLPHPQALLEEGQKSLSLFLCDWPLLLTPQLTGSILGPMPPCTVCQGGGQDKSLCPQWGRGISSNPPEVHCSPRFCFLTYTWGPAWDAKRRNNIISTHICDLKCRMPNRVWLLAS